VAQLAHIARHGAGPSLASLEVVHRQLTSQLFLMQSPSAILLTADAAVAESSNRDSAQGLSGRSEAAWSASGAALDNGHAAPAARRHGAARADPVPSDALGASNGEQPAGDETVSPEEALARASELVRTASAEVNALLEASGVDPLPLSLGDGDGRGEGAGGFADEMDEAAIDAVIAEAMATRTAPEGQERRDD